MAVYLNRYGIVAIKLNQKLAIEDIQARLSIKLYPEDRLFLETAVQANKDRIGIYKDTLLICTSSGNILDFFINPLGELATKLLTTFNNEKMCAVYYYSVPDLFGFSYFENGHRIRTKYGMLDDIWVDIGNPLEIEKNIEDLTQIDDWLVQKVQVNIFRNF